MDHNVAVCLWGLKWRSHIESHFLNEDWQERIRHVAFCLSCLRQSSGAVWKSRWPSWAPVPDKLTVSVDVKQHFNQSCLRWKVVVPNTCFGAYTRKDWRHGRLYMMLPIAYSYGVSTTGRRWYHYNVLQFLNKADSVHKYTKWHNVFEGLGVGWRVQMSAQDRPSHIGVKIQCLLCKLILFVNIFCVPRLHFSPLLVFTELTWSNQISSLMYVIAVTCLGRFIFMFLTFPNRG